MGIGPIPSLEDSDQMIGLDHELAQEYLQGCREHTATLRADLLSLKNGGSEIDDDLINRAFQAVHSIRGGGLFDLLVIRDLAQQIEDVLALIRSREMVPTKRRMALLIQASDRLRELTQNPRASNHADITEIMSDLADLCTDSGSSIEKKRVPLVDSETRGRRLPRALLVDDERISGLLLQTFLHRYCDCRLVVNGEEAVEAFGSALKDGPSYDLVCMDIMMPVMGGREAVRQIRALEEAAGILPASGAKIIMTTAVSDAEEVYRCFRESCDAYLVKPIDLGRLLAQMKLFLLIE